MNSALCLSATLALLLGGQTDLLAKGCSGGGHVGSRGTVMNGNLRGGISSRQGSCNASSHYNDSGYGDGLGNVLGSGRILDDQDLSGGPWGVSVQHPISGQFTQLKEFDRRHDALRYMERIGQRFFVTFRNPGDQRLQFQEARNASAATLLARQLRSQGMTVSMGRVIARIAEAGQGRLLEDQPLIPPLTIPQYTIPQVAVSPPAVAQPPVSPNISLPPVSVPAEPVARSVEESRLREVAVKQPVEPASPSDTAVAEPEETASRPRARDASAKSAKSTIDPALEALIGTWTAVARYGDGQLGTVELQLDDRGWATLTLPQADGTDTTVQRRVVFEEEELQLEDEENQSRVSLGKLVSVESGRLVLERAGGRTTFVRP